MKTSHKNRKFEHTLFLINIWIKGLAGVVEMIRGFLVLFVTQKLLDFFAPFHTAPELAEDSADWVANYLAMQFNVFLKTPNIFQVSIWSSTA